LVTKFSITQTNVRKQQKFGDQIFHHGSTWAMIQKLWATPKKIIASMVEIKPLLIQ
jgi:hypothetical protein